MLEPTKLAHPSGKIINITKAVFFCFLVSNFFILLYSAVFLRPAADDYVIGLVAAQHGAFGGIAHWWNTWSSFFTQIIMYNIFAGMPLAHLPFSIASAIPFLIVLGSTGFVILSFYPKKIKSFYSKFSILVGGSLLWWFFLWTNNALVDKPKWITRIAELSTHWQTCTTAYYLPPLLLLIFYAIFKKKNLKNAFAYYFLIIFAGFFIGVAGDMVAAAFFGFGLLASGYCHWYGKYHNNKRQYAKHWFIFTFSVLFFCFASHFLSPGRAIRYDVIAADPNLLTFSSLPSLSGLLELLTSTVTQACKHLFKGVMHLGSLLILSLTASISYLSESTSADNDTTQKECLHLCGAFCLLALVMAGASGLAENFVYKAYWHFSRSTLFSFFSIVFFGIFLGLYARSKTTRLNTLAIGILLASLLVGTYVNQFALEHISEREKRWAVGPASSENISDIDSPDLGWGEYWIELNKLRPDYTEREKNSRN